MAIKLRGLTSESTAETQVMETLPNEFDTKEEAFDFVKANLALSIFYNLSLGKYRTNTGNFNFMMIID